MYRLLFEIAAETLCTIAADPKHLSPRIGATLVLHTWGSALTHHPHVHGIVPGGGLSQDGERWVACRNGFFLPVRVLSRLLRRRFLEELDKAWRAGQLRFFGEERTLPYLRVTRGSRTAPTRAVVCNPMCVYLGLDAAVICEVPVFAWCGDAVIDAPEFMQPYTATTP